MPMAQALGHTVTVTPPAGGAFSGFYTADGMALVIGTEALLRAALTVPFAVHLLDTGIAGNLVTSPIRVELNVAYSIVTPTAEHAFAFEVGLVYHILAPAQNWSRCTITQLADTWDPFSVTKNHKDMFSNFFVNSNTNGIPACAGYLHYRLVDAGLDTLALFREPYLANFPTKITTMITRNGQQREVQKWYAQQACTNCITAGTWKLCGHYYNSLILGENGITMAEYDIRPGVQSPGDLRWGPFLGLLGQFSQHGDLVVIEDAPAFS